MTRLGAVLAGSLALLAGPPHMAIYGARAESDTSGSTALFDSDGPVATLTRSTFISSVLESDSPAMVVLYHGSDCPQCEEMSDIVESASGKLTSWGVSVGAVDLSKEPKLAKELGMRKSAPMILKVYHSASTPNPYGGLPVRSEAYLQAFEDVRALQKKVLSAVPDLVVSVDVGTEVSSLKKALSKRDEGFAAVLFSEAGKASPALRMIASGLSGKVVAVQARLSKRGSEEEEEEVEEGEAKDVLSGLLEGVFSLPGGIPSVPSLVLVDKQAGTGKLYAGAVDDAQAMMAFVRDGAGISQSSSSSTSTSGSGTGIEYGGVLSFDPDHLAVLEKNGTEALVVAFVNGGDTSVIPGWDDAVKGLQGQIRAGVVDCEAHPSACQGAARNKAPHLRVYPHGHGADSDTRSVPSVFAPSQVKEAVSEAGTSLPDAVAILPAGTSGMSQEVQGFLSSALMQGAGPMALFVLSKRDEPSLVVKTIAAEFKPAQIGTMFISNPDKETMSSMGVSKLPAILLMFQVPEGAKGHPEQPPARKGETSLMTAVYSSAQFGPLNHRHVSDFMLSHLSNLDREKFFDQVREMAATAALNKEKLTPQLDRILSEYGNVEEESSSPGGGDDLAATPFQGIPEATAKTWASMVEGDANGGGVPRAVSVFLFDRYSESFSSAFKAAELGAEQAVARLAGRGGDVAGGFVWVDAPCQEEFVKTLGVSDTSEVPVLVVYSPKHQKSARFVGAWEDRSLTSFLAKALGGRSPMFPIGDNAPRLASIDCSERAAPTWLNGGEGEEAGGEDDDMGDFMAEILAEEAKAKRELEAEVAKGLEEQKEADLADEAPKKKTKKIIKKKKKKNTSKAGSEL